MKKEKKQLLVIIPAYNEEKNIGELLDRLKEPDIASIADVLVMHPRIKHARLYWISSYRL